MDYILEFYLEGKPLSYPEPRNCSEPLKDGSYLLHKYKASNGEWYAFAWDIDKTFAVMKFIPDTSLPGGYIEIGHWDRIDDEGLGT